MRFYEELKNHSITAYPSSSVFHSAGELLARIKDSICEQYDRISPDNSTITGCTVFPCADSRGVFYAEAPKADGLRQHVNIQLTERGSRLLTALKELAEQDGISLDFGLAYQSEREELSDISHQHSFTVAHTHRLTASSPRLLVSYTLSAA